MPGADVPLLIVILILIFLSGFFSSTETAYSCANKLKLKSMITNGNKKAGKTLALAEDYDNLISTILVGNNIVNLTASSLATIFFAKLIINDAATSTLVSTIAITIAVLIFGEITPKFIAKTYPERLAMSHYPFIKLCYYIFLPINFIFKGYKFLISKVFKLKEEDTVTEEEIMTLVEEAEEDGTLKKDETELIRSVIEFDDLEVGDVFVPRVNVVAISDDADMEEIKQAFRTQRFSRLPVYKDSIDTIIGNIHEKDFFNAYFEGATSIEGILKPAIYTTEHTKISKLLKDLQKKRRHMAIVLDEYGGTLGLVTLEDILEELVGEILDEHDEKINFFKKIEENVYLVDARAELTDMCEFFELDGEDENFDSVTVSGWIMEQLGEIPNAGTKLNFFNLSIEVTKANVRKIFEIKVTVNDKKATEE